MALKTEVPGVNNAVQKLAELADRMRTDDFGFRNNDVDNIDKVIDALHQLEAERKAVHDLLETETIKASILRHQLKILPKNVRDEVMEAVMAARKSNAKRLMELQDLLAQMNANIIALDKRSRELEQENAVLHPERELLKQQHEEIISQLNQRMAEKAQLQIALNETRDEVRQANQDIVDLEDGILQLKEDLIQERTEARQEKKRLKKAVTDTTQKTKEQKDQNVHKKKELDGVQEKLQESEGKLDSVRRNIRRYETSRAKLEGEERALAAQLARQLKMNDQMRIKGAALMNERIQESRDFEQQQKELKDRIKQYKEDIITETARTSELESQKKMLMEDLEEKEAIMAEDAEQVAELDGQLQAAKEALNAKAEEVGIMQKEIIEMQEEMERLAESHKAVLAQLNKQIEEYREELSKERKERMELQAQKDAVSKNLDDIKSEAQQFMSEMTTLVQESKRKHTELSNEGLTLQKQLKEDEAEYEKLSGQLKNAQDSYNQMFKKLQNKADTMECQKLLWTMLTAWPTGAPSTRGAEVLALERALEDKTKELEEKTPIFHDLEKYFEERTAQYDAMKKEIVAMKNKKMSLEDEIKRTMKDKEATLAPQAQLRDDLKMKRGALVRQMKHHGESTQAKEQEIFEAGCKLRAVVEENKKFEDSCKKLEDDLADLQHQMDDNEKRKELLELELTKQKTELMKKWETDAMMQEFFASRDEATAEAFQRLLMRTEKREVKIDLITERLKEELNVLAGFLDNISTRRPKELQESMKQDAVEAVAEANLGRTIAASPGNAASRASPTATLTRSSRPGTDRALTPHSGARLEAKSARSSPLGSARSQKSVQIDVPSPRRSARKSPH